MKKTTLLLLAVATLAGCQYIPGLNKSQSSEPATEQAATSSNEVDELVNIADDVAFISMSEDDKKAAYAPLDEIVKSTKDTKSALSYSQITEIKNEEEYTKLILGSGEKPFVLYLGFDECSYCKAFTPKLNHLAKELDVPIYYYNVRKRNRDANFKTAMEVYKIDTVPHAFIIDKAVPTKKVNHASTMAEIESFLQEFAKIKK